jgi:sugar phosphate isomerase/epimerase
MMKPFRKALLAALLLAGAHANPAYTVHEIPGPEGAVIEAGGLDHWPDGTLLVSTRHGDVWALRDGKWSHFASGLLEPMGLCAGETGEVIVTQTPEVTRLRDTDGDLRADRYETLSAAWEMPGAVSDHVYGLRRDTQGNLYGTTHTTHGPWAKKSTPRETRNSYGGPMGAPAIGRGWSFQVDPQGKLTWWSSGLRAPNGVAFNAEGDLFATDNQGDWVGTSAMHHIVQGAFHGHPSSYHWDPKRTLDMNLPLDRLAAELDKIRKRPAVLFPHGILGNSPSEPALAPANGAFGPFAGQFFVGDNVAPLISRVQLEKIEGVYQGAVFPFLRGNGLRQALCRMTFSPAGELLVAYGCRGWGPDTNGLQKVAFSGGNPFEMHSIHLTAGGFEIVFTKPLAEQDLAKALALRSYRYLYHHTYGSPQVDIKDLPATVTSLSPDRTKLTLNVPGLEENRICEFKLTGITAADGTPLANAEAYYTINRLPAIPRDAAAAWPFFPLCVDTHDAAKRSLEEQARLLRELGYDGCAHICHDLGYGPISHPPNATVEDRAKTLAAEGLRLTQAYGRVYLERDMPINLERITEMMPTLAEHQSQLGLLLLGNRSADLDGKAVEILGKIADIAKPHGVPIVIYPHATDYTETVGEALRVVRKLDRPEEVGVMFNLCHWQPYDPNRDFREVLTNAGPYLKAVSINGTNRKTPAVLPLADGDFDVQEVLDVLRELEYRGPVGLMCWAIGGDARDHLTASMGKWQVLTSPPEAVPADSTRMMLVENTCEFETAALKGRIGDGRFIGLNRVTDTRNGAKISGDGIANRHGLLTLYRVFTRNHRYGDSAYDWKGREMKTDGDTLLMTWPATPERPFGLQARYAFPKPDQAELEITVTAEKELVDFEVQVASYFDSGFPVATVPAAGDTLTSPAALGPWHAFPRDDRAAALIADGRWQQGGAPVAFTIRPPYTSPRSVRKHATHPLTAILESPPADCFAIYTAHDGEAHFSNYHALFGRTIPAGETATARASLRVVAEGGK